MLYDRRSLHKFEVEHYTTEVFIKLKLDTMRQKSRLNGELDTIRMKNLHNVEAEQKTAYHRKSLHSVETRHYTTAEVFIMLKLDAIRQKRSS